jgi:hypothetical protein
MSLSMSDQHTCAENLQLGRFRVLPVMYHTSCFDSGVDAAADVSAMIVADEVGHRDAWGSEEAYKANLIICAPCERGVLDIV